MTIFVVYGVDGDDGVARAWFSTKEKALAYLEGQNPYLHIEGREEGEL